MYEYERKEVGELESGRKERSEDKGKKWKYTSIKDAYC
jgi:hypothetical protein